MFRRAAGGDGWSPNATLGEYRKGTNFAAFPGYEVGGAGYVVVA